MTDWKGDVADRRTIVIVKNLTNHTADRLESGKTEGEPAVDMKYNTKPYSKQVGAVKILTKSGVMSFM